MITCNELPVLSLHMALPLSGLWVAALEVASDELISGAITLEQDTLSYAGYVVASSWSSGTCRIEAVGGAGGMIRDVEARSYRDATVRTVAGELLAAVGESLETTSTRTVTSATLTYWTRAAGRAALAMSALASSQGARWRVLPSGAVWLGVDAWKTAYRAAGMLELDRDGPAGTVLMASDTIGLVPGVTVGTDRVGRVEHSFGRDEAPRTTYWTVTA